ncbi:DUF2243 domain-containing protein [Sinorhizobium sp. 22678]|uniref:DUF2243 domain-containing protein n=1 Tax=Sinorhizobium sp. 22678 TaxID=3453955 RepID=UPI003F868C45
MDDTAKENGEFPAAAGILLGLGLGGFFDGIVLHQVLQWHHMLSSAGFPPDSLENLRLNTFFDGLFHVATYVFVVLGLIVLWRRGRRSHRFWSARLMGGSFLIGFGALNLIEGTVNHQILGLHHVNETVPRDQWVYWDTGFLLWGASMLIAGWVLYRSGKRERSR